MRWPTTIAMVSTILVVAAIIGIGLGWFTLWIWLLGENGIIVAVFSFLVLGAVGVGVATDIADGRAES